jgi:protein TonB
MEPKKNPKYDIHRNRGILFNFSLALSLLLVITAFKWEVKTRKGTVCPSFRQIEREEMTVIPITHEKKKDVPAPVPVKTQIQKSTVESVNIKAVSNNQLVENISSPVVDQNNSPMVELPFNAFEAPEEKTETDFRVVEKMPEPVGGWEAFFKTLQKHMKYPRKAEREQISGKVFVEFTVNATGAIERISILKGIGYGCDEEAQRVIALTKWNPGKQRGRPVNVRLVQPVTFSLGTPDH